MDEPAFTRAVEGLDRIVEVRDYPEHTLAKIVRAVLEAVRTPDTQTIETGYSTLVDRGAQITWSVDVGDAFTAMIDAILIQDPAIPVVGKLVAD
jgi:hypothetical protein